MCFLDLSLPSSYFYNSCEVRLLSRATRCPQIGYNLILSKVR
jgi:hypothetical protein